MLTKIRAMVFLWSEEGYVEHSKYSRIILDREKGKTNVVPQSFILLVNHNGSSLSRY
jgi:hypothetical protein